MTADKPLDSAWRHIKKQLINHDSAQKAELTNPLKMFWKIKREEEYNARQKLQIVDDNNNQIKTLEAAENCRIHYEKLWQCVQPTAIPYENTQLTATGNKSSPPHFMKYSSQYYN